MRVAIVGGPGCGKTTLALELARSLGVVAQCTDTPEQAQRTGRYQESGILYAPSSLGSDWSGLSRFVCDSWLSKPGPWVIEGVALVRALRKHHDANEAWAPPCDRLVWCSEPLIELEAGQERMLVGHNTVLTGLLDSWPELSDMLEVRGWDD